MREIQSLARGLKALTILAETKEAVSVTTVSNALQIDKGSASLLLQTLANYGFAEKDSVSRQYQLGPAVMQLSRSLLARMPLRETAKPFLLQLVEVTGECAHLGVYSQGKVLYIDQVESPHSLRVNTEVGFTAPLHNTALGKVLLAWHASEIPLELEGFTRNTIVDPEHLAEEMNKTRDVGFALDDEEFTPDVRCIAAPVMDFRGKVIGALGISGPAARVTMERVPDMANEVMAIARSLSERMSFIKQY